MDSARPCVVVFADLGETGRRLVANDPRFVLPQALSATDPGRQRVAGVVVRSESQVGEAFLDRFPALRFVIRAGSGTDNIDLGALQRRGVRLVRCPDVSAASVAEIASLGLASLARQVPLATALMRRGRWQKADLVGESAGDLTVTIWGAGPVGRAVGERLERECRAVRFAAWRSLEAHLPAIDPAEAWTSDAHVCCLPLRPATELFFGGPRLLAMAAARPYLLNVGRYETVEATAAVRLLGQRQLRGVFFDPVEPRHLPALNAAIDTAIEASGRDLNLMMTPHLGAQRRDVLVRLADWAIHTALVLLKEVSDDGDV